MSTASQKYAISVIDEVVREVFGEGLTHFPETEELKELWQYDGGLEGTVVQVTLYDSPRGPALEVDVDPKPGEQDALNFSGLAENWTDYDWRREFKQDLEKMKS